MSHEHNYWSWCWTRQKPWLNHFYWKPFDFTSHTNELKLLFDDRLMIIQLHCIVTSWPLVFPSSIRTCSVNCNLLTLASIATGIAHNLSNKSCKNLAAGNKTLIAIEREKKTFAAVATWRNNSGKKYTTNRLDLFNMQKCCRSNKLIKRVIVSSIGELITLSSQRNRQPLSIAFAFEFRLIEISKKSLN